MGHLFLLMNTESLQGTELCLKAPMNFQKSLVAERHRKEQDKSSQGTVPMEQLGHGQFCSTVLFAFGGSVLLSFLVGGHFSEIIFVPQQKKAGVVSITLHMFRSKNPANCDLGEIKLVVKLSSYFLNSLDYFFFLKFDRALESVNIWNWWSLGKECSC